MRRHSLQFEKFDRTMEQLYAVCGPYSLALFDSSCASIASVSCQFLMQICIDNRGCFRLYFV